MAERPTHTPRARVPAAEIIVLALGSGAVNAFGFAGLGGVFTSVMTGNLVLLGLSGVRGRFGPALHSLVAVVAYTAGVYAASFLLRRVDIGADRHCDRRAAVLAAVPILQAVVAAGWLAVAGRPGPAAQIALLVPSAVAMGVQSTWVNALRVTGAATTYFTGTLTDLTAELVTGGATPTIRLRAAALTATLGGAALDAVVLSLLRPAAAVLPPAAALTVVLITWRRGVA